MFFVFYLHYYIFEDKTMKYICLLDVDIKLSTQNGHLSTQNRGLSTSKTAFFVRCLSFFHEIVASRAREVADDVGVVACGDERCVARHHEQGLQTTKLFPTLFSNSPIFV